MRKLILSAALIALAACSRQDNAPGPGGVSVGEARALDEAAEMVEGQRLPADAVATSEAPPASARPVAAARK